jgi:hypothetical protein
MLAMKTLVGRWADWEQAWLPVNWDGRFVKGSRIG